MMFSVMNCSAKEQPNLIIILSDDLGYSSAGFNGLEKIKTTHLDQMAKDGMFKETGSKIANFMILKKILPRAMIY